MIFRAETSAYVASGTHAERETESLNDALQRENHTDGGRGTCAELRNKEGVSHVVD